MVQYNVVVYAFSIHFNRFYRSILVENSEISNDYKSNFRPELDLKLYMVIFKK